MKSPWLRQYRGLIALSISGLAIAWVLAQTGTRGNPNPNPVAYLGESGLLEVVLEQNQVNQYVATGRINGDKVEFLVDTGSADVAMPYSVALSLGLQLTPGGVSKTGNGNVQSWSAYLDSVDVGGIVLSRVKATVLPNMHGDQVLLGMSYLKHMEVVLAGGTLTLKPYVTP